MFHEHPITPVFYSSTRGCALEKLEVTLVAEQDPLDWFAASQTWQQKTCAQTSCVICGTLITFFLKALAHTRLATRYTHDWYRSCESEKTSEFHHSFQFSPKFQSISLIWCRTWPKKNLSQNHPISINILIAITGISGSLCPTSSLLLMSRLLKICSISCCSPQATRSKFRFSPNKSRSSLW